MKRIISVFVWLVICATMAVAGPTNNFKIHKGTNVSHWLSQNTQRGVARELHIDESDFANLEKLGFDFVRLPIDEVQFWDVDSTGSPTKKLPEAWKLMNNAVNWATKHHLRVIVDLHIIRSHYFNAVYEGKEDANTLFKSDKAQQDLIDMWYQLSADLKAHSCDSVAYEFMNEPVAGKHEQAPAANKTIFVPQHELWNALIAKVHKALRKIEPRRTLVIGSNLWQGYETMKYLEVPTGDKNIILSFHYYNPMLLTHYGAWFTPAGKYRGKVNYPGILVSKADYDKQPAEVKKFLDENGYMTTVWNREKIASDFKDAIAAAKKYDLQLFCGEWGVYEPVDRELAYQWTADMLSVFKENNIAWATWCYDADFGFWNQQTNTFKDYPLVELLTRP